MKRSLDSAEADSACFLRMGSLRTFFVGGAEEETFLQATCLCVTIEFAILRSQGGVGVE